MKKLIAFLLTGTLSAIVLFACNQERRVQAGREDSQPGRTETQQPTPAPGTENYPSAAPGSTAGQEIKGELRRIDMSKKTIVVRTDNGLEQTFRFNDNTTVSGLPSSSSSGTAPPDRQKSGSQNQVRNLMGKEGSEVTVHWTQQGDEKIATMIHVSQVSTKGKSKTY